MYRPRQKEFHDWCTEKKFGDGDLVYEAKLVAFLDNVVIPRGYKRRKSPDGSAQVYSHESIEVYVKAMVDLYQAQKASGGKGSHPRGAAIKALKEMLVRADAKRKRGPEYDRGLGTVLDGYNVAYMKTLTSFWLRESSGVGLRDRVDFLVGHALVARGQSRRFIQLADMLTLVMPDEGPQPCTSLVVVMTKGKTNQSGRVEYGAAMRHKKVLLCPLNAVAMYLFWRWHIELEPFPNLNDRRAWYGIHLLKGSDPRSELSYNAQLESVKRGFKACSIDSTVWTHANRESAARMAELNGADEDQIRRAGRWSRDRMETCYLTTIPRKALRALAGFSTKGDTYWLARATIEPCKALQRMVHRDLDDAEAALRASGLREIAASGFVQMLHDLRVVFLQDSVLLRRQFPDHPIWRDVLFES